MKRQVLLIHGAGQEAYEEDEKLAVSLRDVLGDVYNVRYPKMPESPEYEAWKEQIARDRAALDSDVILVGHSLGASVLLKYLTEEKVEKPVTGLFLVAPPYWGAEDWEVSEYTLQDGFASRLPRELPVFLYHSRDDDVVPFAHLAMYTDKLAQATVHEFDGRGHQFNDDLSEVARDIRGCRGGVP
jgi:predicted alpha/beta hydrolase family esterase